jgi:DNA polymerase-4
LHNATNITGEIYRNVVLLFNEAWKGVKIRHLGVRVTDLCSDEYMQASVFDETNADRKHALDAAIDIIREKYGNNAVMRAVFADYEFAPMTGGSGAEDYPVMSSVL